MAGGMFPITKEDLAKHESTLENAMSSIRIGTNTRGNLIDLLKGLKIDKSWTEADDALRKGFSLYYELYDQLQRRIISEKIDGEIPENEKRTFMASYSTFGAAAFIQNRITRSLEGDPMKFIDPDKIKDFAFQYEQPRDDVLNQVLAVYHNFTAFRKDQGIIKDGQTLVQSSIEYFKFVQQQGLKLKPVINKKLVDLVQTTEFRILDDFTLSGFEEKLEEKIAVKNEIAKVSPDDVAGNVLAKKEMLRDMDRITLYDPILKKNPIVEVGGLSWSVMYVGLPGTGKSTLFLMGYTRLGTRCEQVSEFWKTKNFPKLVYNRIVIDPKVKDKMYGGTAAKMAAADQETADKTKINIGLIDDIDLLMEGDRDSGNGGADKDILNGLMQILGGVDLSKRKTGNTQWWAATNEPTKMDPALLQRFAAKYEVNGPEKWYDYADILRSKLGGWLKPGMEIIQVPIGDGYKPFEMRKDETGFEIATPKEEAYINDAMKQFKKGIKTFKDIGDLCEMFKKRNPRFTGRAIDAVNEAIKKKINDYDIPQSWFENPDEFFFKPYEERVAILRSLCKKVDAMDMAKEVIRYARTEEALAEDKFNRDVEKEIRYIKVGLAARAILKQQMEAK